MRETTHPDDEVIAALRHWLPPQQALDLAGQELDRLGTPHLVRAHQGYHKLHEIWVGA